MHYTVSRFFVITALLCRPFPPSDFPVCDEWNWLDLRSWHPTVSEHFSVYLQFLNLRLRLKSAQPPGVNDNSVLSQCLKMIIIQSTFNFFSTFSFERKHNCKLLYKGSYFVLNAEYNFYTRQKEICIWFSQPKFLSTNSMYSPACLQAA